MRMAVTYRVEFKIENAQSTTSYLLYYLIHRNKKTNTNSNLRFQAQEKVIDELQNTTLMTCYGAKRVKIMCASTQRNLNPCAHLEFK